MRRNGQLLQRSFLAFVSIRVNKAFDKAFSAKVRSGFVFENAINKVLAPFENFTEISVNSKSAMTPEALPAERTGKDQEWSALAASPARYSVHPTTAA
ncbi:hypothetical protein ACFQ3K_12325 [Brucella gallinifaecis]|uniref:hypothetical protein n=1 Tax=Brucella gallinifaecis TaxID=215590 RepID=UPI00130DFC46|nr:hypothetical protein [Brucella gallinifaecis]